MPSGTDITAAARSCEKSPVPPHPNGLLDPDLVTCCWKQIKTMELLK